MDSLEPRVKHVLRELITLARLKEGEKLSVRNGFIEIQPASYLQSVSRWFRDSRDKTMPHLEALEVEIKNLLEIVCKNSYLKLKNWVDEICSNIETSLIGFENLKKTYPTESGIPVIISSLKLVKANTSVFCSKLDAAYAMKKILSPLDAYEEKEEGKGKATFTPVTLDPRNIR